MDLNDLRSIIDDLDGIIISVLARRMGYVRKVVEAKKKCNMELVDARREGEVVEAWRQQASDKGLDPDFAEAVVRRIIAKTLEFEKRTIDFMRSC